MVTSGCPSITIKVDEGKAPREHKTVIDNLTDRGSNAPFGYRNKINILQDELRRHDSIEA